MATNIERQLDEIEALSSICSAEEFFKLPAHDHELALNIAPNIEKGILRVKYSNVILKHSTYRTYCHFSVKNLPPSRLRIHLPPEYPDAEPPHYTLEISWLPPWECSLVCSQLDELWADNSGGEILFLWREFLQNEILDYLNHNESLDVSFLFALHDEPHDSMNIGLLKLVDTRAKNDSLFLHPMEYLAQHDEKQRRLVFARSFHICGICFEKFTGLCCIEFHDCGHVYCKNCTAEYFTNKINENQGERILCPDHDCYCAAKIDQIREICPNLCRKYEELVLVRALSKMKDVVYCPRNACQLPVIIESGESLATCNNCNYNFCLYCRKVYHGVAPCVMTSEDSANLIEAYMKANSDQKQQLLKKYGRRQIQSVVEERLSKDYIKDNTKPCPECQTPTEKINGCNKMHCSHCRANFCWLCGIRITSKNSYDHFTTIDQENTCFGRLFEGMPGMEDEIPDNAVENVTE